MGRSDHLGEQRPLQLEHPALIVLTIAGAVLAATWVAARGRWKP